MKSSLKERIAKLGPVKDVDQFRSGSPVDVVLRWANDEVQSVSAALLLSRRGLSLLRAKRAVEAMLANGEVAVHLPSVESIEALASDLWKCGVESTAIADTPVDVRAIRDGLGMTQEQFALRFNIELAALRNWEQGRYVPDRIARSYFRAIRYAPHIVGAAQEQRTISASLERSAHPDIKPSNLIEHCSYPVEVQHFRPAMLAIRASVEPVAKQHVSPASLAGCQHGRGLRLASLLFSEETNRSLAAENIPMLRRPVGSQSSSRLGLVESESRCA